MEHSPTLGNDLPPVWELVALAIVLAGMIAAGVWAVLWARRWRQNDTDAHQSAEADLSSFRQLLDQGLLKQEEYDRLHRRLGEAPSVAVAKLQDSAADPAAPADDGIDSGPPPVQANDCDVGKERAGD